ncbi:hypothetical protein HDU96_005905 [Phlyctochytrium bullatum]|nr:hypothetical protein HDU96_005905 [Phlyctochytrium bullatum]
MPSVQAVGIRKQARFRMPLFVSIMLLVVMVTVATGLVVGYITLSRSLDSIYDITGQMRNSILNRCREEIVGTIEATLQVLRAKSRNTRLSQFIASWEPNSTWMSLANRDIVSYHNQFANEFPALENTGLLFRPEAGTVNQSYLAAYPKWGQIYHQDSSTNYVLTGAPINGQNDDYSLQLGTNTSVIRTDWIPNDRFPDLKTNGLVRGQPFWASPIYTPVVKTFLIPVFWPVWLNLPIGRAAADGNYHAAHFAMLSIASMDTFLRGVEVTANGAVSLIEGKTGLMLASSIPDAAQNGTQNQRFSAVNNPKELIASAASFVAQQYGTNGTIESIPASAPKTFALSFKGSNDEIMVNGYWVTDQAGLRWLILLTIPAGDFLSQIRAAYRNAIISAVAFLVASLLISALMSYLITAPLAKLARSMMQATQFDFSELKDGYLHKRSCVTEIGRLEGVFHELMVKFATAIRANKALLVNRGENINGLSTTGQSNLSGVNHHSTHGGSGTTYPPKNLAAPWE